MSRIIWYQAAARIFAAVTAVMLPAILQFDAANAADWYTGAAPAKPSDDWIVTVDASASGTSTGSSFAAVSATIAADGALNTSGARVRIEGLTGTYKFASSGSQQLARGDQAEGSILAGYQWVTPTSSFSTYGGLAVRGSQFSNNDPSHAPSGTEVGFKGVMEYYARPSDRTMFSAYGSYSTNFNAYYTRLKYGVISLGQFYVGPEIAALGDDYFREWRVGAHVTGIQLGALQFGFSGGYLLAKDGKGGGYGTLDMRAAY